MSFITEKIIEMTDLEITNQIKSLIEASDRIINDAEEHKHNIVSISFFSWVDKKLRFICTWNFTREFYNNNLKKLFN